MVWGSKRVLTFIGEVAGSGIASYIVTSRKLKDQQRLEMADNFCPKEAKTLIVNSLEQCKPVSSDLTRLGRMSVKNQLEKNDYFGTLLSIDSSTKPTKRTICIIALKTAAKCICAGYNVDGLRAATYSYLAERDVDLI